ncbi:MAG: hypothetical protein MN733_43445 [Nitrososphaera sp.]|nr:hypothetical protein [Nitrososphaera sp.]
MAVTVANTTGSQHGAVLYSVTMTAQNDVFVFTADNANSISIQCEGVVASDIALSQSNDGTTYYDLATDVTFAADGLQHVATTLLGAKYYRVLMETASESVVVTIYVKSVY